jgi:hypothetical protein
VQIKGVVWEGEGQKAVGQEGGMDFIPIDFLLVGLLCIILSLHIALPQTPLGVHVIFFFAAGGAMPWCFPFSMLTAQRSERKRGEREMKGHTD